MHRRGNARTCTSGVTGLANSSSSLTVPSTTEAELVNRLPLPLRSDQRPVSRIEFASFALLAMPGHRTLVLTPPN
jgi:hypothetical protein